MANKKTVFITGGTGTMGWAAFQELLKYPTEINIRLLARKGPKNFKLLTPYLNYPNVKIVWGDLLDYEVSVTEAGQGYTALMRYKQAREAERTAAAIEASSLAKSETITDAKADYLRNKQSAAEERKKRNRLQKLRQLIPTVENDLDALDALMSGEAATDYKRAAELDARRTEAEDELMAVYEELEELESDEG